MSAVNNYFNSNVASTLSGALPAATKISGNSRELSPFAQMLSALQQQQQANPTQYRQLTQQIASNLQTAAQTAQANGKTAASSQLNQLATDFSNAAKSGQLPNVKDLLQAMGSGAGHQQNHFHLASAATPDKSSSSSSNGANPVMQQMMAAFQSAPSLPINS